MKVYIAGFRGGQLVHMNRLPKNLPVLASYAYMGHIKQSRVLTDDLLIDSGAYSVSTSKAGIDIDAYCNFLKGETFTTYVSLDVIGDGLASKDNYDYMCKKELSPIPVFHHKDPWWVLDYYLDRAQHIGIGGVARTSSTAVRAPFLDKVWNRIYQRGGKLPRVHGFGTTARTIIQRYPWYSVDSTSWQVGSRFGMIMLPNGKMFRVAHNSPEHWRRSFDRHISVLNNVSREALQSYLAEKDFTLDEVMQDDKARNTWNILVLEDIGRVTKKPAYHTLTLFDD